MTGRLEHASPLATASLALALVGILAGGCGSSSRTQSAASTSQSGAPATSASALAPTHGAYSPKIDPANFVATVDNRYFPLLPGTAFHYEGVAENGKTPQTDDMVVTRRTKTILGVRFTTVPVIAPAWSDAMKAATARAPSASVHIAFAGGDPPAVDAFHREALAGGGKDNGRHGLRPQYHAAYYGAFVLDPDGNNIEAVCHDAR